jgi:hypothetical protein
MVKTNRRKALTLLFGAAFSSAVSGCVTGYVEGTEDYLKFCIERQPNPNPSKCPKQDPSLGMGWIVFPYSFSDLEDLERIWVVVPRDFAGSYELSS